MDIGLFHDFALAVLMRDAATDRLITKSEIAVQSVRWRADPLRLKSHCVVADDGVLDISHHLFPGHGLDEVGIDIANEPILQTALEDVAPGMAEDVAGFGMNVDLLYRRKLRPDRAF